MPAGHRALPLSRRAFVQSAGVAGLGLLTGCGRLPFLGQAQAQPPKVYRIGWLAGAGSTSSMVLAFAQGLHELGYIEGQNLLIEKRITLPGRNEQYSPFAAELAALPLDALVTGGISAVRAAMNATQTIPIVFAQVGVDPVAAGLVASYARPGGNVTGLTGVFTELAGKKLQLVKEVVPAVAHVAVLYDAANPDKLVELHEFQDAAEVLGIQVQPLEVRTTSDWEGAFAAASQDRADVILTLADSLVNAQRQRTAELALLHRLPTSVGERAGVAVGSLMFYGANIEASYRRAAAFVDRILKGAKPADLPVEQPMRFDFVINLKTAQALGLTIPQHVLLQATEVIQ
ncbi:MAG TPA: ABC transporter substrate-binding protein [Chloroflexota bacterium]|jgi:putative ABC transport system substrate-binding protein